MRLLRWLGIGAATLLGTGLCLLCLLWALRPPTLPVPDSRSGVYRDVTLVEPGRAPRSGVTLRIEDGRIAAIEPVSPGGRGNGENADLSGLLAAPGLVDMHVHYPPRLAVGNAELWSLLLLSHGVTSVRETGSIDGSIFAVRDAIRSGERPGPRIFACGAMLDGERPSFPSNRVVHSPVEARAAVEEQAARGADCIKAYNMLSREALGAIREAAERVGLPVVGHAPHSVSLEEAGLVDLQHGTGVVLVDRTRIGRSDFRSADWQTVDAARIGHAARVSLDQDIAHTPTLLNARMRRWLLPGEGGAARITGDSGLRHLPGFWFDVWSLIWSAPFAPGDAREEALHDDFRRRQAAMTAALHRAGARIHAGTDTLMPYVAPGSSLHGELAELERAGIARNEVWAIGTRNAGDSLGEPGLGTLRVGAPADLVFLRSHPDQDLAALARPEAVLADGRLYRRADLDRALARFDSHFHGRLYEAVMGGVVSLLGGSFAPEEPVEGLHADKAVEATVPAPETMARRAPGAGVELGSFARSGQRRPTYSGRRNRR